MVVLTMAEFGLRLSVRGGRTAYPPSGEPSVGSFGQPHWRGIGSRLQQRPGAAFRSATSTIPRGWPALRGPGFCHRLAREGIAVTKPPHPAQAGLIPEP